jgi:hypothetical protein
MSRIDPAPWEPTSAGDRTDRMGSMGRSGNLNTSLNTGLSVGDRQGQGPGSNHIDTAFAYTVAAALPPYRGESLVVPSSSYTTSYHREGKRSGGERDRDRDSVSRAISPPRVSSSDPNLGGVDGTPQGFRGPTSKSLNRLSGPRSSSSPRSRASRLRDDPYRASTGGMMQHSGSEDREDSEEEEAQRIYRGSSHPLTPSAVSHGRTVIMPWQTPYNRGAYQGDTSGPGQGYRGRERRGGGRDIDVDNERDRDREREGDRQGRAYRYHRGGVSVVRARDVDVGRENHRVDYVNDNEAENISHASLPSVQSQLTTDTATMINRERNRERERGAGCGTGTGTGIEPEKGIASGEEGGKDTERDKGGYERRGDRYE